MQLLPRQRRLYASGRQAVGAQLVMCVPKVHGISTQFLQLQIFCSCLVLKCMLQACAQANVLCTCPFCDILVIVCLQVLAGGCLQGRAKRECGA
jgi:hypothetical protein